VKRKIQAGTTSFLDSIFIRDTSTTTAVKGLTGLSSASTGLTLYYFRAGSTGSTAVTLTSTGTLGTWVSGWFKEMDATNMPGWYEVGVPNAAVQAGAPAVRLHLRGAANMEDIPWQYELDAVNYQSSSSFLTGVNGIAPPPNWNLMALDGSGRVTVGTNADKSGYSLSQAFPANFAALAVTAGGAVTVGTNNDKSGYSLSQAFPANFSALAITGGGAVTVGTNNDKTGYSLATAPPTAAQVAAAVWQDTTAGDFAAAGSPGKVLLTNLDAQVSTRSTYAGGAVASVAAPVTVGTNNDKAGYGLAASGLDLIPITDPGGVAGQTTFPKVLVALYRRFFRKTTLTASQLQTFADNGTVVNTTQAVSDDGTTQAVGAAT
jgi:hypothetical protein